MSNPFIIAEDLALKTMLKGMTVSDKKNMGRSVQVWFGYPDVELTDQQFPFVTIDLIDIIPANDRQHQGRLYDNDYRGTIAPSGDGSYGYDIPIAYDLVYQVTSYSRHPRHDRAIQVQLLQRIPSKYGKLAVPNQLGTETAYRSMFLDGYTKLDSVEEDTGGARRILRNALTVRVISEMTPYQAAVAIPQVEEVFIDNDTTPPTGYEMV
jgi:hypothetical protein